MATYKWSYHSVIDTTATLAKLKEHNQLLYQLLASVLAKYGCLKSTFDHGFFVKGYDDGAKLYIALTTDDLLCGFHSFHYFQDLKKFSE